MVIGGPWSLTRVSRLVEEIGGALISAHAAGVTHGDVRASNVLLDDEGSTYLIDFGLAVCGDNGDDASVRRRMDVVDFARLLWELLCGVPPVANGKPGRLPSLVGGGIDVPSAVDAVIAEATTPGAGFDSVAELVLAWRAAVGRPEGVLSPLQPDSTSSARRLAARQLVAATAGANPYRGLRSFGEADSGSFFGRDAVIDALSERVRGQRFTAVVGPSGSGKSSVLHAGLLARWRQTEGARVATMVPGDDPIAALRVALSEVAVKALPRRGPVETILAVAGAAPPLLLVVDQFEECWTVAPAAAREELITALATVATDGGCDVRVVVAIRSDFYDAPLQDPVLGALIGAGTFPIPPMSPGELDDAIVRPAERLGVTFDESVVAAMVAETAARPATLPMLQFVLAELFDDRVDGRISTASYERRGGLGGAIGSRAEEIYASLGDDAGASARELFGRLVTPGTGVPDTRRRTKVGELSAAMRTVAEPFVGGRLLVADHDQASREPVLEIAHEALLDGWPRLKAWIDEDRVWLQQLQHVASSAVTWDDGRATGQRALSRRPPRGSDRGAAGSGGRPQRHRGRVHRGRARRSATPAWSASAAPAAGCGASSSPPASPSSSPSWPGVSPCSSASRPRTPARRRSCNVWRASRWPCAARSATLPRCWRWRRTYGRRTPTAARRCWPACRPPPGSWVRHGSPGTRPTPTARCCRNAMRSSSSPTTTGCTPSTATRAPLGESWAPFDASTDEVFESFTTSADGSMLVDLHNPDVDHVAVAVYDATSASDGHGADRPAVLRRLRRHQR